MESKENETKKMKAVICTKYNSLKMFDTDHPNGKTPPRSNFNFFRIQNGIR